MSTLISLFDYELPEERIAQASVEPRDRSKLLILDRKTGAMEHRTFFKIAEELHAGDVLVMNDTKVFKARLHGRRFEKTFEVFLLRALPGALPDASLWHALVRPGRKLHEGNFIEMPGGILPQVVEKRKDGTVVLAFPMSMEEVIDYANREGEVPVPPYVKQTPVSLEAYQTVYAKETGSVAAPTAGFHFTPSLIDTLKRKGVQIEMVTLHVGLGTFRPVKTDTLEEHQMHEEFVTIDAVTAQRINEAKQEGRRVIAVGTTTVRALEGAVQATTPNPSLGRRGSGQDARPPSHTSTNSVCPEPVEGQGGLQGVASLPDSGFTGDVNLFIAPGFQFQVIDGLITNFHLPKSTLLVLVCSFAGREAALAAYREAIRLGYRFYSFGDAMFIH